MRRDRTNHDSGGSGSEDECEVEAIRDMRTKNGVAEFFLKWKGFPESENTWEPRDNLDCPDLISAYINSRKIEDGAKAPQTSNAQPSLGPPLPKAQKRVEKPKGFDRGLEPDRILGATDASGELTFLVKWKGTDEADLVPARVANAKCPQTVIRFYEERLTWCTHNENDVPLLPNTK